ncbi:MAG TPA: hypothetical protein VEU94_18465, partial [Terriglobales bacterium]|nr:hypothetical protein [Terriglobales bacterium]
MPALGRKQTLALALIAHPDRCKPALVKHDAQVIACVRFRGPAFGGFWTLPLHCAEARVLLSAVRNYTAR